MKWKQLSFLKPLSIFAQFLKKGTEDKLFFFFNVLISCSDSDTELLVLIATFKKGNSCEHKLTCFFQEVEHEIFICIYSSVCCCNHD